MQIDPTILEAIMICCFGAAWPFSIYKTVKAKSSTGKSPLFLCIILCGYLCGIVYKLLGNYDYVILFYSLNFVMVFIDLLLTLRFSPHKESVKQK